MKNFIIVLIIFLLFPASANAETPKVIINEIAWMGTAVSGNDEWIELYNSTENDIDLSGWKLETTDGSPSIELEGIIEANKFFILERTDDESLPEITASQIYTGSLSNSGEYLKLYNTDNNVVDEINADEAWPYGDNTTKQTLERKNNSQWQSSAETGGTPNEINSESIPNEEITDDADENNDSQDQDDQSNASAQTSSTQPSLKNKIIFTEIFANPAGTDLNDEFFELTNVSSSTVDITNWIVTNNAKQSFQIPSFILNPGSIVVFYRNQTKLALNNNSEKLTLKNNPPTGGRKIINQVSFKNAPESQSYSYIKNKLYDWTHGLTPGEKNTMIDPDDLPMAIIYAPKKVRVGEIFELDASDSFSPLGEELKYFWDFGDNRFDSRINPKTIFFEPGRYEIALNLSAKDLSIEKIISVSVEKSTEGATSLSRHDGGMSALNETDDIKMSETVTSHLPTGKAGLQNNPIPNIFISEFLPNPAGADSEEEFIELFNQENFTINLSGWQLDDEISGSKPYIIKNNTLIKSGEYKAFFRTETKLALNNDKDEVRLFHPNGMIIDQAVYAQTTQGQSHVIDQDFSWHLTQTPTPGEINMLDEGATSLSRHDKNTTATTPSETATSRLQESPEAKNKNKYLIAIITALAVIASALILRYYKGIKNNTD